VLEIVLNEKLIFLTVFMSKQRLYVIYNNITKF
jgi:hypothetical protein